MTQKALHVSQGRLVRLLIIALVLVTAIVGYSRSLLPRQESAPSAALRQELGVDDGFAVVLFYGSDIGGNLEPCGCPSHPAGGLARRASYVNAFKAQFAGVPVMQLDVGHFFSWQRASDGTVTPEMLVRNSWVMRGYEAVQHDVANLSHYDLIFAQNLLDKASYRVHERETPIIRRLISANVRATDEHHQAPPAYLIKELTGDRLPLRENGQRVWRVGVVGVTERPDLSTGRLAGLAVDDPLVASRRAILQARRQCDLLVVLAYVSEETAFKLLDLNPEVDIVITPRARWGRTYQGGHGWLVYADPQTKLLGELRIYLDEVGRIRKVSNRHILLDDRIPGDPAIEQLVRTAREQIAAAVKAWLSRQPASWVNVPKVPLAAGLFVTAHTCSACHHAEFAVWSRSAHARAFAALENRNQHLETKCLGCHTTGYESGGFQQVDLTPHLTNVQCEACHGPGQEHIADPLKPYGQVMTPQVCLSCHTRADSPEFDWATYWAKIQH